MKKIITLALAIFFITTLQAQVPKGTYVPKNDLAKASNWVKFEFTGGNKVKAYIGAMGVTVGAYEYIYTLNGNNLSLSVAGENGSAEGFTYNRATDEIALMAGVYGSEGAIWCKAGAVTNNPTATNPVQQPPQQGNTSSGKVPSGTYMPQNKVAEMSNFTKFVFTGGNKLKVYFGVSGTSVASYDYIYTLNGNALSLMEAGKNGSVEFTYDRINDRILLHAGAFGTEGAIWGKEGKPLTNDPGNNECDVKPDIASISYNHELAKRCALFSALAYQETRIKCDDLETYYYTFRKLPQGTPIPTYGLPTKDLLFSEFLSHYKELKDNGKIVYFTGKRNDGYVKKDDNTPYVLYAELKYLGYEGIVSRNYRDIDEDNISYTFAYKKGNGNDIGVAVILRGTDYVEWQGNMKVWKDKNKPSERHYSFQEANTQLQEAIKDYLDSLKKTEVLKNKNIHFLITGHSRGAAVANLLAADLNEGKGPICGIKSVHAYTFATPNNTTNPKVYNNIFNFCFDDDFVPQVPLDIRFSGWKYGKNGINYHACAEELYSIDPNSEKYKGFDTLENKYIKLSTGRNKPDFNSKATNKVLTDFKDLAPTVDAYYTTKYKMQPKNQDIRKILLDVATFGLTYEEEKTLYEFMYDYIAKALIDLQDGKIGSAAIGSFLKAVCPLGNDVHGIADFFIRGGLTGNYINDTHQALTYYYALSCNGFKRK